MRRRKGGKGGREESGEWVDRLIVQEGRLSNVSSALSSGFNYGSWWLMQREGARYLDSNEGRGGGGGGGG